MDFIFGAFGWIILSFVVYAVANNKGRSGCAWFFISLLLSPLIAFIVLLCVGDSDEKKEESLKKAMDVIERARTNDDDEDMNQDKAIEELQKAKKLLDLEVITQDEYDAKKAELMPFLRNDFPSSDIEEVAEEQTLPVEEESQDLQEDVDNSVNQEEERWYRKTWVQTLIAALVSLLVVCLIGFLFNSQGSSKSKNKAVTSKVVVKPLPSAKTKKTSPSAKSDSNIVVIGRWSLKSVYNSAIEIVEIYKKDGKYYSKERGGRIILLDKRGDRYYYTGMDYANDSYYKIINGKLRICDDELGDYTEDSGYIITTLQ